MCLLSGFKRPPGVENREDLDMRQSQEKGSLMTDKYVSLEYSLDPDMAEKLAETAKETGMPEQGVFMLVGVERAIQNGDIDPKTMLSGQDMLNAIAEKLELEGDNPKVVEAMTDKLRALSYFATTHLVPVTPP
jgi:hypothetical protein